MSTFKFRPGLNPSHAPKSCTKRVPHFSALSHMEIVSNALLFFLAGYETTATAMSWTLYNLALNEDIQQTLFDEIENALEDTNVS